MYCNFFSQIDIELNNVNILNDNTSDLNEKCAEYEFKIACAEDIDLFLNDVDSDDHITFNKLRSSLNSRTHVKTLAYDTLLVNSCFFDNDLNKMSQTVMTVDVQTIMNSQEVIIIMTDAHKALALQNEIENDVNHM